MGIKQKLVTLLPNSIINVYRKYSNQYRLKKLAFYDRKRFVKYSSLFLNEKINFIQIKYRMIYATHGIEKGLSHPEFRPGFGKDQIIYISELVKLYKKKGFDKDRIEYKDTLSVIKKYIDKHNSINYDIPFLEKIFDLEEIELLNSSDIERVGVHSIQLKSKKNSKEQNFKELSQSRYSVRNYSNKDVEIAMLEEAVEIAMKTPSACNRQMWRVHIIKNKKMIEEVFKYQRGMNGYELPNALLAITVDLSSFQFPRERNEAFVDGGLFSMSLLYSLEFVGLAACTLNSELTIEDDEKIRNIISIPNQESIILFISVGHFLEEYSVCKSPRINTQSIIDLKK